VNHFREILPGKGAIGHSWCQRCNRVTNSAGIRRFQRKESEKSLKILQGSDEIRLQTKGLDEGRKICQRKYSVGPRRGTREPFLRGSTYWNHGSETKKERRYGESRKSGCF